MPTAVAAPRPLQTCETFGFKFERGEDGWRWTAFDTLGRITEHGLARSRAEAAANVIRALART